MSKRIDDLGINDLKIVQDTDYFCFGMDSVLLANFVISKSKKSVVLDLCSGSGVIPVIISAKKECGKIIAVELQEKMYELLEENILKNDLGEKIIPFKCDVKDYKNIVTKIKEITNTGTVDIVVCNPPYKKCGSGIKNPNDIKTIARHEVLCSLEDIFITASKLLNTKGKLYLVHKPERLVDLLSISRKYKLEAKNITFIQPTKDMKPSIVLIEYVKNGGNEVLVQKNIIEYNDDGSYTDEIYKIYGIKKEE